jgi:hypothetical protein
MPTVRTTNATTTTARTGAAGTSRASTERRGHVGRWEVLPTGITHLEWAAWTGPTIALIAPLPFSWVEGVESSTRVDAAKPAQRIANRV